MTQPDVRVLAGTGVSPAYVLNLKLSDAASAPAFINAFINAYYQGHPQAGPVNLLSWQSIATGDALLVTDEQQVLTPGAWLLGLLAMASVAVLVGGRMSERTRRVGLLKAVGGTPGLVAAVLMAENVILAVGAAVAGLVIGRLAAPLITSPGAGLVGTPGAPSLTLSIAGQVIAVALIVALAATLLPAFRAARTSTVSALADAARPPRRRGTLIKLAARLPVPLLFGLRLVARRPRRAVLGAASIAITVTGLVAVIAFHDLAGQKRLGAAAGLGDPIASRDEQMLLVLTVALVTLAVLNAIVTAWAMVLDARHFHPGAGPGARGQPAAGLRGPGRGAGDPGAAWRDRRSSARDRAVCRSRWRRAPGRAAGLVAGRHRARHAGSRGRPHHHPGPDRRPPAGVRRARPGDLTGGISDRRDRPAVRRGAASVAAPRRPHGLIRCRSRGNNGGLAGRSPRRSAARSTGPGRSRTRRAAASRARTPAGTRRTGPGPAARAASASR